MLYEYLRIVGLLINLILGCYFQHAWKNSIFLGGIFSTCFKLNFVGMLASNLPHFLGIFPKN